MGISVLRAPDDGRYRANRPTATKGVFPVKHVEFGIGHISKAAEVLRSAALVRGEASLTFNGVELRANRASTPAGIVADYMSRIASVTHNRPTSEKECDG